jgi:hypothetical protein
MDVQGGLKVQNILYRINTAKSMYTFDNILPQGFLRVENRFPQELSNENFSVALYRSLRPNGPIIEIFISVKVQQFR